MPSGKSAPREMVASMHSNTSVFLECCVWRAGGSAAVAAKSTPAAQVCRLEFGADLSWGSRSGRGGLLGVGRSYRTSVLLTPSSCVARSRWWRRWTWGRRRSTPGCRSGRTSRCSPPCGSDPCRWRLRSWCTGLLETEGGEDVDSERGPRSEKRNDIWRRFTHKQRTGRCPRWWTSSLCWGWRAEPRTQRCPGWRRCRRGPTWPALPGGSLQGEPERDDSETHPVCIYFRIFFSLFFVVVAARRKSSHLYHCKTK